MKERSIISIAVRILLTFLILFLIFWFALPAINLRSSSFRFWLCISALIMVVINFSPSLKSILGYIEMKTDRNYSGPVIHLAKPLKVVVIFIGIVVALTILLSIIGTPLFCANAYYNLIQVKEGSFTDDVAEISMTSIPVVDRNTAVRLGSRKLGEMSDMVSQFEIEPDYTQINYKGRPTRVTPLVYADPIKWLNNHSEGIPGYITVDLVSQETSLVRLNEKIRYSRGDYFMRNINRYLRFSYPTKIFDEISFEIDDNGTPYWVAPTIEYDIALISGKNINGAVLVNAITGESALYSFEEIPAWVDQVCISNLVITQLNYYGAYGSGFFNSIFGQRGVLATTEGYNYLALDDDVYLYTGLTSVLSDESNIGFVLVNLRTKETRFYSVPGAEEYSAMSSAEGQVQNLKYVATFPILLNVADRPTYFLSLKDAAELVKMYAFVDVEQYQVVATGVSVAEARKNYIAKLSASSVADEITDKESVEVTGTVREISQVVIDGTTGYYFTLQADENIYFASINVSEKLAFLSPEDTVKGRCTLTDSVRVFSELDVVSKIVTTENP